MDILKSTLILISTKSAISAVDIIARWNVVASLSLRSLQQCILAPWHFFGGPPLNKRLTTPRKLGEYPL